MDNHSTISELNVDNDSIFNEFLQARDVDDHDSNNVEVEMIEDANILMMISSPFYNEHIASILLDLKTTDTSVEDVILTGHFCYVGSFHEDHPHGSGVLITLNNQVR